jgi:hypothetical protein
MSWLVARRRSSGEPVDGAQDEHGKEEPAGGVKERGEVEPADSLEDKHEEEAKGDAGLRWRIDGIFLKARSVADSDFTCKQRGGESRGRSVGFGVVRQFFFSTQATKAVLNKVVFW